MLVWQDIHSVRNTKNKHTKKEKYIRTRSKTKWSKFNTGNYSLDITIQELREIYFYDRFLEPRQWREVNISRQWIPNINNSFGEETASFKIFTMCWTVITSLNPRPSTQLRIAIDCIDLVQKQQTSINKTVLLINVCFLIFECLLDMSLILCVSSCLLFACYGRPME